MEGKYAQGTRVRHVDDREGTVDVCGRNSVGVQWDGNGDVTWHNILLVHSEAELERMGE